MASRRRWPATQPVSPSLIFSRTLPMLPGWGGFEAQRTRSSRSIRYIRHESHCMNSPTSWTVSWRISPRLMFRTIMRLILWKTRSCCSVRSRRVSSSLYRDTPYYPKCACMQPRSDTALRHLEPNIADHRLARFAFELIHADVHTRIIQELIESEVLGPEYVTVHQRR